MRGQEKPGGRSDWPWPELTVWDLGPYDRGLFTLATFVDAQDVHDAWASALHVLHGFRDVIQMLVRIRESGRRIPVRCHMKVGDLALLGELVSLVRSWRADGGEPTRKIHDLALNILDAVNGSPSKVERGEPWRDF